MTARLSAMMFLQFFIWGCWFVTLGTFLGANFNASGAQTGLAFSTQSWGAIIAPFIIGLIADRYFNAERILAVLHLLGALLMYQMFRARDFERFYPYVLAYMIAYMPTLALVNSISFRQLTDPSRQFSFVRVWGTLGWIVAGLVISFVFHFYYQNASPFLTEIGTTNATGKLTIGQMSEVAFMLLLPVFLLRFGIKKTLLLGMLAWAIRYALFAYDGPQQVSAALILGIALHGICYDFFFVSGQIYTDSKAGLHYRSAAQGMITLATYGVGMLIGFSVAGSISDRFNIDGHHDWFHIWIYPAAFAAVVLILFALLFRNESISYTREPRS